MYSSSPNNTQFNTIPVYSFSPRQTSNNNISQIDEGLQDYDDLPSDHKPILPPKTGNQSNSHLNVIDNVQLALHNKIMSRSFGNLPTKHSTPNNFYTLQGKKRHDNKVEPNVIHSEENRFEREFVPLPPKQHISKTKITDISNDTFSSEVNVKEFEDYDEPVIKHNNTSNNPQNNDEEFEDYDEPVIKHTLAAISARSEFEDYDEPIHHASVAPRHKRTY